MVGGLPRGYLMNTLEPIAAMPQRRESSKSGRLARAEARKAVREVKKARSSSPKKGAVKKASSWYAYRYLGHFGSGTVREGNGGTSQAGHRSRKKTISAKRSSAKKQRSARY